MTDDDSETRAAFLQTHALAAARVSKTIGLRLSVHGISLNEYLILDYLASQRDRGVPRIELAGHMGLSASGVTRLVAPMEKTHLVEREAHARDARQSLVRLTDAGARVHREAQDTFVATADELTRGIQPEDLQRAIRIFDTIR